MSKKTLKTFSINEETYQLILNNTDNNYKIYKAVLDPFKYGYKNKSMIYYNQNSLICTMYHLSVLGLAEDDKETSHWYQVWCQVNGEQKQDIACGVNPIQAIRIVNNILRKHYTQEEINDIYNNHECEESEILHLNIYTEKNKILKIKNCYYYDANGAYASELINMFPKCINEFTEMFERRHENNNKFKNVFNYFVGCLTQNESKIKAGAPKREIHPKTRHYIVNNISNKVMNLLDELNPEFEVYINTDGFVIKNPSNLVDSSKTIGTFKIEDCCNNGDVYTYRGANYMIIQMGDEIKGNLPLQLRQYVDLREGKVVSYTKHQCEDGHYEYINIKQEEVTNYEEF